MAVPEMQTRAADAVTACDKVLIELATVGYGQKPLRRRFILATALTATADGEPLNASEIAERLNMPRATVHRHLRALVIDKCVRKVRNTYVVDLDAIDRLMSQEDFERSRRTIAKAQIELDRASAAFRRARRLRSV